MAEHKNVVIRVPNGHRQTLKISPNTTILQILEEVCQKHGFNANKYNLKHHNNILDPNAIFRFTGLVNNAPLEMVQCTERSISNVTIGVQLENGTRLTGEFTSDTTLLGVLLSLCPGQDPEKSALIYLHRVVYGTDELEKTTLQSLGLNGGRAMLRLKTQESDQAQTQAHVTVPLAPKSRKHNGGNGKNKRNNKNNSASTFSKNPTPDFMSMLKSEKAQKVGKAQSEEKSSREEKPEVAKVTADNKDTLIPSDQPVSEPSTSSDNNESETKAQEEPIRKPEVANPFQIEFSGDRNALIFNQASVKAVSRDELPENFYDLTIEDAKVLLRDAKRRRAEIEEAPFRTQAQRELSKEQKKLEHLHKYRHAIIRIQFPDQLVLQGIFKPLEKIQAVKEFIKEYLADPECDFTIYTTPPKHILNTESRLVDENLVPSSIVYYSGSSTLKQDIRTKLAVPDDATLDALRKRKGTTRGQSAKQSNENDPSRSNETGTMNKISNMIPKWFSQSFKK